MLNRIIQCTCALGVLLASVYPFIAEAQTPPPIKNCSTATPCSIFWNANTEPDMDSYKLYARKLPATFPVTGRIPLITVKQPQTALNQTVFMGLIGTLTPGDYSLALTATDTSGNESGLSNEIMIRFADATPPAIPNLKLFQVLLP